MKVQDESMSDIYFCTTAKGNLPHLYYILRKPEPLGTKFNTVACSVTGGFILIEIQRGNYGIKEINYHLDIGVTAACNRRIVEAIERLGQR